MKTPPFLKDFIDLFFPRLCPVCQRALNRNEEKEKCRTFFNGNFPEKKLCHRTERVEVITGAR